MRLRPRRVGPGRMLLLLLLQVGLSLSGLGRRRVHVDIIYMARLLISVLIMLSGEIGRTHLAVVQHRLDTLVFVIVRDWSQLIFVPGLPLRMVLVLLTTVVVVKKE